MSVEGLLTEAHSAPMADAGSEPPDEVLVVAAIVGDLQAFDQLVLRYRAAVARVATSIVGHEHAEDVAQDAWLLAFKALPSIEEPRKFAAWLSAITRHRAMRFGKSESRLKSQRVALDDVLIEKLEALSKPLSAGIEDLELRAALETLPPDYALTLKLRFLDEMPLERIAAFTGAPLTTVKWRVHQGKKLLRKRIEAGAAHMPEEGKNENGEREDKAD
jgi:RNA polymerase sigma-70 factor (ECF subfamily)